MSDIDITLPDRVPEMSRHHSIATGLKPFAIYILSSDPNPSDLDALIETTNSLCPRPGYVKPPPTAIFENNLKSVIHYHLTLSSFDPRYFLAATTENWREKGVLVITLDDDDLDCKPDSFRCKAEDTGILLVNLQIGNTDWCEARENYEIRDEADTDESKCTAHPPQEGTNTLTAVDAIYPDGAPKRKPSPGFYIPIYAIHGIDANQLIRTIQPAADKQPATEYVCRFEGYLPTSTEDPVRQAMSRHPEQCRLNPHLHKTMFLVADNEGYEQKGLLMCDVEGKAKRVKCDVHTLVPNFCGIARGQQGWDD